jgi:hypothetical protein
MDQALIRRAFSAYLQSDGLGGEQPTSQSSVETTAAGRRFVVLRNERRRILAVFRVRNSGFLRRMRQWPMSLNGMGSAPARERVGAHQTVGGRA